MLIKLLNLGALGLWLFFSVAFLGYVELGRQVEFDAKGDLERAAFSQEFQHIAKKVFASRVDGLANRVVHIQQAGCGCNLANDIHVAKIDSILSEFGFSPEYLHVTDLPVELVIPATPAVAIFDHNAQLAYFGPYSSGYFCSSTNAIVDGFLAMIMREQHYGPSVVTDGVGCYCPNS